MCSFIVNFGVLLGHDMGGPFPGTLFQLCTWVVHFRSQWNKTASAPYLCSMVYDQITQKVVARSVVYPWLWVMRQDRIFCRVPEEEQPHSLRAKTLMCQPAFSV